MNRLKKTKHTIFYLFFSLCSLFVFISSCTKDSAPLTFGDFPTDVGKIMTYKCATSGCHNDASYQGEANLNLSSFANLFKGSVNGSPVIPYRSDFSSLCYFINTYDDLGIKNLPTMPINANALSRDEVTTIKNWIDNGAPDINGNVMWSNNSNRKKYYVVNQGCDVVTVFDAATQLPIRYITVGKLPNTAEVPHVIKISPDGNYWYVVFVNNNILQKYRTSDDALVGEVTLGADLYWNTITISNDSKKAYCVSWQGNSKIATVNLETMHVIHYNLGTTNAHGSALNKTNDTLYVTSQSGNFIYKVDTGFTMIPAQITIDMSGIPSNTPGTFDPHEILFSADGSKYFVTCEAANQVRVMNTSNDLLLQVINTGAFPLEMVKSNAQQKLYVTCQDEPNTSNPSQKGCVTVIDMNTYSATNYPVGFQPHGIGLDETNGYVIVASRNVLTNGPTPHHTGVCGRNGFVNYFNITSMQLLKKQTEVASDPYSISVRP